MPIISKVEAKSLRGRLLFVLIFLFLAAAGFTMIYPFAVTVAGSLCSPMDQADMTLVPRFLTRDDTLYRKFLETKYNQSVSALNAAHVETNFTFASATVPGEIVQQQVDDLRAFARDVKLPSHWQVLGALAGGKIAPEALRELQGRVKARFAGDLDAFGRQAGTALSSWTRLTIQPPAFLSQQYDYQSGPVYDIYFEMLGESDLANRQLLSLSGYFLDQIVYPDYGKNHTKAYNAAHPGEPLKVYTDFVLPPSVPSAARGKFRGEWIDFVSRDLHPSFVRLEGVDPVIYHGFLRERYGTVAKLNEAWRSDFAEFDTIDLPSGEAWLHGSTGRDYQEFFLKQPVESWRLVGPEYSWRQWLRKKYGSIEALNNAHRTRVATFDEMRLPMAALEYRYTQEHTGELRSAYATRNYRVVFREIIAQGRPFWNTLLICGLTVLLTLLVNPMAAYAMSRFELPGTYKILLILMVTAAFPPMVVLVPQFLILRGSGLLNTFAALIIPFITSGYLIFLLKGFFDSLPRNLYEAAMIDGASEFRMFFTITMSLSKPILAVVAL